MKTIHLILFLILIWIMLLFYKRREYFSHSSNLVNTGKVKLNLKSINSLVNTPTRPTSRYQQLYESGKCSSHFLSPLYDKGTGQFENSKFCRCDNVGDIQGGLIPIINMPTLTCSKNDFIRGITK
jgi:hypothetical protein